VPSYDKPGYTFKPIPTAEKADVTISGPKGVATIKPIASTPLKEVIPQLDDARIARAQGAKGGIVGPWLQVIRDKIVEVAGDVPVHLVREEDYRKVASPSWGAHFTQGEFREGDHIVLPTSGYYSASAHYYIMHEGLHAVTARMLDHSPEFKYQI